MGVEAWKRDAEGQLRYSIMIGMIVFETAFQCSDVLEAVIRDDHIHREANDNVHAAGM
jgi:hypothetical protein